MIEFRGMREDSKEWVYGWLAEPNVINVEIQDGTVGYSAIEDILVIPETLGMGTTIKGKKFFTGDIVCWSSDKGKKVQYVVNFEDGSFTLNHKDNGIRWTTLSRGLEVAEDFNTTLEIIGNIHEK